MDYFSLSHPQRKPKVGMTFGPSYRIYPACTEPEWSVFLGVAVGIMRGR